MYLDYPKNLYLAIKDLFYDTFGSRFKGRYELSVLYIFLTFAVFKVYFCVHRPIFR